MTDNLLKPIITVVMIVTIGCLLFVSGRQLWTHTEKYDAQTTISEGTVVKHEYVNGYKAVFGDYVPARYRLHIEGTYEYNGETYTDGTNYFDVSEEAYYYYKDGDHFNSATFTKEVAENKKRIVS